MKRSVRTYNPAAVLENVSGCLQTDYLFVTQRKQRPRRRCAITADMAPILLMEMAVLPRTVLADLCLFIKAQASQSSQGRRAAASVRVSRAFCHG